MKTARDVIATAAKLSASVQSTHDDLECGYALLLVNLNRNAPTVVLDANRIIGVQRANDFVAVAGKRFVNGVIENFVEQVVQSTRACVADVHSGPLAHRFEPFQHLNVFGSVGRSDLLGQRFLFGFEVVVQIWILIRIRLGIFRVFRVFFLCHFVEFFRPVERRVIVPFS